MSQTFGAPLQWLPVPWLAVSKFRCKSESHQLLDECRDAVSGGDIMSSSRLD